MKVNNVFQSGTGFKILGTTSRSQTAIMTLEPGESSSDEPNMHASSDQVLIVLEGEVFAEASGESKTLRRGDSVTVRAGTPHTFSNHSRERVVTFSVYAPPAYPPSAKE